MKTYEHHEDFENIIILTGGSRNTRPLIQIQYFTQPPLRGGKVVLNFIRDGESMNLDDAEIFLATLRKELEIAHQKEQELEPFDGTPEGCVCKMPTIEMNADTVLSRNRNDVIISIDDHGGCMSTEIADRFTALFEKIIQQGRELAKLAA